MDAVVRITHVIYRLDTGGMENGLVNLINRLPAERFSHAILCLTHATEFRRRIRRPDVEIVECNKPEGKHLPTYRRIYRELKRLQPDIVHTRNLGTLEMSWIARLAGCPHRIHSEHGWSAEDPKGLSRKYRMLRRLCDPVVERYVAVSGDIARWLTGVIGIADGKIETIHNGVDLSRFRPVADTVTEPESLASTDEPIRFGTVGRQEPIKGLDVFLQSLSGLMETRPEWSKTIRAIMAGDGPDHDRLKALVEKLDLGRSVELPGLVEDVPGLLAGLDFFVQPSLNEGISNTVLEAMASGLPVIATDVGGNPELVRDDIEGKLVSPGDADELTMAMAVYIEDAELRRRQGEAARHRAEEEFSLDVMAANYERMYCDVVGPTRPATT